MTSAATAAVGLALLTVLAPCASLMEGRNTHSIQISPSDSCGGDYEGTKGNITSPNYPSNSPSGASCIWTVTTPPNTRITVTIENFNLDTYGYGYLEIRNGHNSSAELMEKCTKTSCTDVTSSTNTLYFYYESSSYSTKGFKLTWFSDPGCGEDYTETKGSIASANHPNNYPKDVDCVYTLMSPINTRITVNFESFETYNSYDYLQIRDGIDMNAELLERCSGTSCEAATSTNNSLYIHFHTSNEDQASGFMLNWYSGLPEVNCYYCSNGFDSDHYDPACGEDQYNGHDDNSNKWNACYTNVHYDGSHHVERGGTENPELEGFCFDSGFSITCYCQHHRCNNDLCQNCTNTSPPSASTTPILTTSTLPTTYTTIQPSSITTKNSPTTFTPSPPTSSHNPTTSQSPTPAGPLQCYSCIDCQAIDGDTQVETSEEFLTCFTAIELGASHFVIRGGSPDLHVDGSCRQVDGVVYECYCTSNICNSDAMDKILGDEYKNINVK